MITIAWFSAGVSSAVATKLMVDEIDRIIYTHIDDQHSDTFRFVRDCEKWFGRKIEILQSGHKNVETACLASGGFVNSPHGAACSRILKRRVRQDVESLQSLHQSIRYVWGMDIEESKRAENLHNSMPHQSHIFPLIDKKIGKTHAHKILTSSGIKRPAMYDIGYVNNNCIGCVKGGMAYWNKIRKDFPDVFQARAKMERQIGASCINGVYLDELDKNRGRQESPIVADCGMFCESLKL